MKNKKIILSFLIIILLISGYFLFGDSLGIKFNTENKDISSKGVTNENGTAYTWDTLPEERVKYDIASSKKEGPRFLEVEIDPLKVFPGDTQNMKVVLESSVGIDSVVAKIETDKGIRKVEMSRIKSEKVTRSEIENRKYLVSDEGKLVVNNKTTPERIINSVVNSLVNRAIAQETKQYTYEASWVVEDTHVKEYETTFVAKNIKGAENTHTMAWYDPCSGIRTHGSGNDSFTGSCTIGDGSTDGVANGNVDFTGDYNVTLSADSGNGGGAFVIYEGYSIDLSDAGSFSIGNGARLQIGNGVVLILQDPDGDGHAPNSQKAWAWSVGNRIAVEIAQSVNDCYDEVDIKTGEPINNSDIINPGQNSYFSSSGANGWDYNCSGSIEKNWPTTISSCNQLHEYKGSPIAQWTSDLVSKAFAAVSQPYGWLGSSPGCGKSQLFNTSPDACGNTQMITQTCR